MHFLTLYFFTKKYFTCFKEKNHSLLFILHCLECLRNFICYTITIISRKTKNTIST